MFGSMGGLKEAKKYIRQKKKRTEGKIGKYKRR
jgi:hypothetical protein